jgi:hypothetical protein
MNIKEKIIEVLDDWCGGKSPELADQIISAFKEMVEERITKIFVDYPDTEQGNRARYENTCRIGELRDLLSSLTEDNQLKV